MEHYDGEEEQVIDQQNETAHLLPTERRSPPSEDSGLNDGRGATRTLGKPVFTDWVSTESAACEPMLTRCRPEIVRLPLSFGWGLEGTRSSLQGSRK
jgi:hypothetical protein